MQSYLPGGASVHACIRHASLRLTCPHPTAFASLWWFSCFTTAATRLSIVFARWGLNFNVIKFATKTLWWSVTVDTSFWWQSHISQQYANVKYLLFARVKDILYITLQSVTTTNPDLTASKIDGILTSLCSCEWLSQHGLLSADAGVDTGKLP